MFLGCPHSYLVVEGRGGGLGCVFIDGLLTLTLLKLLPYISLGSLPKMFLLGFQKIEIGIRCLSTIKKKIEMQLIMDAIFDYMLQCH